MREENLHLTLKFLGEVKEEGIEEISKVLKGLRKKFQRFEISLEGIGAFPSESSPRVIWIGVEKGKKEMIRLQRDIEDNLVPLGFKKEGREFHPHLTIARVKSRVDLREIFKTVYKSRVFSIDRIILFKSTLTPEGPIYEKIEEFPLPFS